MPLVHTNAGGGGGVAWYGCRWEIRGRRGVEAFTRVKVKWWEDEHTDIMRNTDRVCSGDLSRTSDLDWEHWSDERDVHVEWRGRVGPSREILEQLALRGTGSARSCDPPNQPPTIISIGAVPTVPTAGDSIYLIAHAEDPDHDALRFVWNEGVHETRYQRTTGRASSRFPWPTDAELGPGGWAIVRLQVFDEDGASASRRFRFRIEGVSFEYRDRPVTAFVGRLEEQHRRLEALEREVRGLAGPPRAEDDEIQAFGLRMAEELQRTRDLLLEFADADTRRGLKREWDLIFGSADLIGEAWKRYRAVMGLGAPVRPDAPEPSGIVDDELRGMLRQIVVAEVQEELEIEGLDLLLDVRGFEDLRGVVAGELERRVEDRLERETEDFLGVGFREIPTLEELVRARARQETYQLVARLLVDVTTSHLVISLVGDAILRWAEPRIREALRNKGDLEFRTERSLGTLEEARLALNALQGSADLDRVDRALIRAQGAINATRFLRGDLERAGQTRLLAQLADGIGNLQRTVELTEHRFLLEDRDRMAELRQLVESVFPLVLEDLRRVASMTPPMDAAAVSAALAVDVRSGSEERETAAVLARRTLGPRDVDGEDPLSAEGCRKEVIEGAFALVHRGTASSGSALCLMSLLSQKSPAGPWRATLRTRALEGSGSGDLESLALWTVRTNDILVLSIHPNGTVLVARFENGEGSTVIEPREPQAPLAGRDGWNRLSVEVDGDRFRWFVNGHLLGETQHDPLGSAFSVGVIVGTGDRVLIDEVTIELLEPGD